MDKEGQPEGDIARGSSANPSPRKSIRELIEIGRSKKGIPIKMNIPVLEDPYEKTANFKDVFRKKTAYCFLPNDMHHSPWDSRFPECPQRSQTVNDSLIPIYERLEMVTKLQMLEIDDMEMLTLVHSAEHVLNVREMCVGKDEETAQLYDSIYFNGENSYIAAVEAAKMTVTMAAMVAAGTYQNGFANVRPPGHHATPNVPNGYCFFNNVAIAARYLLNQNPVQKILIVDYDVHHGQGTQRIFYNTDRVLYFSIHRHEFGTFWPNLKESSFEFIGNEKGKGYNINVPLNETGLTDYDYMTIITNVLLPVAYEYDPTIILVSAGYDACIGCPEGRMNVSPAFYAHLITMLGGLAGGKILVVLEGGYFLPSLGEAALKTVQALLNDPCPQLDYHKNINPSVIDSINNVKVALRPYWKCFYQVDPVSAVTDISNYDRYENHVAVTKHFGILDTAPFPTKGFYPKNTSRMHAFLEAKLQCLRVNYDFRPTRVGYMVNVHASAHEPPLFNNTRSQDVQRRLIEVVHKLAEYNLTESMIPIEFDPLKYPEGPSFYPEIWNSAGEAIFKTHCEDYIQKLIDQNFTTVSDFYVTEQSKMVCQFSCAVLCQIAREIRAVNISHGVGIVRPPGHHAKHAAGSGFCLINNVVVTANYAINKLGYRKILILDFDVHHGDGTQELTYSRNDIMYISMHRYNLKYFYPKDPSGNFMHVGEGRFAGYNLNIPFEDALMGNADYLYTWIKVVLPMSYAFNPDLILISAGFDAGVNDPVGNYRVHPEVFGHFIQLIKPIAPLILALEGGYNFETTSLGMVNCVRALLGHPLPMPTLGDVKKEASTAMANSISVMKPYWPIMQVNKNLDPKIRSQSDLDYATKSKKKLDICL